MTYLLLYIDDIILKDSSFGFLLCIIASLHGEFSMIDLGPLNYFLGISSTHTNYGIFLSQAKYATKILQRAHMLNCNLCRTPVDTKNKLGPDGSPVMDPTLYRSLAGLQLYRSYISQLIAYSDADWAGCPSTRRFTSGYCVFLRDNLLSWFAK
ncbi:ribonuclease H-like domain-containing protein [Tanacetum coccineum]